MQSLVDIGEYQYVINKEIGRGTYGIVYDCQKKSNPSLKLCVKVISQIIDNSTNESTMQREMDLMKLLVTASKGNQNIVQVEYVDMKPDKIFIVLERCEGDLEQLMDKKRKNKVTFNVNEALDIMKQVIHGYKILFCNNIIHRDMKPANILYRDGVYKIADFGLARIMDNNTKDITKVGTPKYAAPQLFHEQTFTSLADVYSIGIMFYELIFGVLPYKFRSIAELRRVLLNIKENPIKVELSKSGLNLDIANLIESMLKYNESERISWEKLFQHPLMKDDQTDSINNSIFIIAENSSEDEEEKDNEKVAGQFKGQQQEQPVTQQPIIPVSEIPEKQKQQKQLDLQAILPINQPNQPLTNQNQQTLQLNQSTPEQNQSAPQQCIIQQPNQINFQPQFQPIKQQQSFPMVQLQSPLPKIILNQTLNPQPPKIQLIQLIKSPVQTILSLQRMNTMSDQLYQIGLLYSSTYQLLDRFTTLAGLINIEIMGLKITLFYLANCFFEHSKAQKQQTPGKIPLTVIESESTKQNQVKQCLEREIEANKLQNYFQLRRIRPDISDYSQQLLRFYQSSKMILHYCHDRDYFLEYLQYIVFVIRLLLILEKIEDLHQVVNVGDLYNCIQEIQKLIQLEQSMRNYINSKRVS